MQDTKLLEKICKLVRYDILTSTTAAGSGHATSSLSAVELAVTLFFGGFLRCDLANPHDLANDRFILSKGHASPLLYSLYQAAGVGSSQDLQSLRKFNSPLQGHPTVEFPYVDVATGSLGQGLSVGLGMALGIQLKVQSEKLKIERIPHVFVLLGDSEFSEGQIWEALQLASYYKVRNLVGILDVNRLGQRGETMLGWDTGTYQKRIESFGWETITIDDGHDLGKIQKAFESLLGGVATSKPKMIIAKTIKGKGVSFLENQDSWHGKALPKEKLDEALKELGEIDKSIRGIVKKPEWKFGKGKSETNADTLTPNSYVSSSKRIYFVATREAYGNALVSLGYTNPNLVVLDAEVSNSTFSEKFKKQFPHRFLEMFIAEQNMISVALGLSKTGFIPFASTFAAFTTRAFDQIRMAQYSKANIKLAGSHAGVSIGQDGPSQMGLEDIAMMRSILESTVFYPADAVSTVKLVEIMTKTEGLFYIRTTRSETPVIYGETDEFEIGGSKVLKESEKDVAVVFTAGITLHEALKAHDELEKEGINIAVVDLYSIKPIDQQTIQQFGNKVPRIIVVEDHYPAGGIGEAVAPYISNFIHLAVKKIPRSGTTEELLAFEEIDAEAIKKAVKATI